MSQPDIKRDVVLAAATVCFSRYGFKRTAMDDIAQEAGLSRPALYLLFPNKETIFRVLSQRLHNEALERVKQLLSTDGPLQERVEQAIAAKVVPFFELVQASPHAAELVDADQRWAGDIGAVTDQQFRALLTATFAATVQRGDVQWEQLGLSPEQLAHLLAAAVRGVKSEARDAQQLREHIGQLVAVFVGQRRSDTG